MRVVWLSQYIPFSQQAGTHTTKKCSSSISHSIIYRTNCVGYPHTWSHLMPFLAVPLQLQVLHHKFMQLQLYNSLHPLRVPEPCISPTSSHNHPTPSNPIYMEPQDSISCAIRILQNSFNTTPPNSDLTKTSTHIVDNDQITPHPI